MVQPFPSQCPFCRGALEVTEVSCTQCNVQIRGHFSTNRFDSLTPEQRQFLETFLRCRGVIRDVETALGISYPTVRSRLDGLLSALGFADGPAPVPPPPPAPPELPPVDKAARRKEILEAISAGRLDAQAGLDALQKLSE